MTAFPIFIQRDSVDCGPASLGMIAKYFGKAYSLKDLRERSFITREGVSMLGLSDAAESIGFKTTGVKLDWNQLKDHVTLPCIAYWQNNHFVVVYKIRPANGLFNILGRNRNKYWVYVADPARGLIQYTETEFRKGWMNETIDGSKVGYSLLLELTDKFYDADEGQKERKKGLSFIYPYLVSHKNLILQLLLSFLISSIIELALPFLTQAIIDKGINYNDISFLKLILFAQMALLIGQAASGFIRGWITLHLSARINISLISHFLVRLMKLPLAFFDSKKIGDVMQRITDNRRVELFLTSVALPMTFSMSNLVVFGFVLAIYDLKILLLFLIGSAVYFFWVRFFLRYRKELDNRRFAEMTNNQNTIMQLIDGIHEIKLNNSERKKRWEWEKIQAKIFKISISSLKIDQYQQAGAIFINNTKNFTITFIAAQSVIEGRITLGMMLAIQYIIGQLNVPVNQFIDFLKSWQDARLSIDRLNEIENKDSEDYDLELKISTLPAVKEIRLRNLYYQYSGPRSPFVLENIDVTIPANKVTAIVGTSGSGKTTLLKLILGFYNVVSGEILVGGNNLKNINCHLWRRHVGAVMQDGFIFSDTIANNIAISDEVVDKDRLHHAAEIANIKEFIDSLPLGFATQIGNDGIGISQGQRQRILIARAIYKSPDFLILDEATNALDANNERVIVENLHNFFQGKTVIVVAHRLSTVKNADNILVLEKGKVVEQGTHSELVNKKDVYFNLVKNQLELGT